MKVDQRADKVVLRAVITRADGTVENLGTISHHNPIINWFVQLRLRLRFNPKGALHG